MLQNCDTQIVGGLCYRTVTPRLLVDYAYRTVTARLLVDYATEQ